MNRENQLLVTDEPAEFEKFLVDVQDFRKGPDRFRGIYCLHLKLMKKNQKMSTCNQLDLETLGYWPIMHISLPGHWSEDSFNQ